MVSSSCPLLKTFHALLPFIIASIVVTRARKVTSMSIVITLNTSKRKLSLYSSLSPFPSQEREEVNLLKGISCLNNEYYSLRHGQSTANVAGIISSDPRVSTKLHGLSNAGKEQACKAGAEISSKFRDRIWGRKTPNNDNQPLIRGVAIISSDFRRARETAQIISDQLASSGVPLYNGGDVVLEERLRERDFGNLHGSPDSMYGKVWMRDAVNPLHTEFQVESVCSVMRRTTALVLEIDENLSKHDGSCHGSRFQNTRDVTDERTDGSLDHEEEAVDSCWACILVAHGDVLQILQTAFAKMDGSLHRTLPHLETASLRALNLA